MIGWLIALVGILLVVANPMVGIGIFILGVIVVMGSSGSSKASTETMAFSALIGLFIGCIVILLGVSAAVGILGALF